MTKLFKTFLMGLTLAFCTVCRADSLESAPARPDETSRSDRSEMALPTAEQVTSKNPLRADETAMRNMVKEALYE